MSERILRHRCGLGFLIAIAAVMVVGCLKPQRGAGNPEDPDQARSHQPFDSPGVSLAKSSAPPGGAEPIIVRMHFEVLRIELPTDGLMHSLKIWNHVDESVGDPQLTALLARNGFRIGVASRQSWPAMRAIFEENGGRSTRATHTAQDGSPLIIELGRVEEGDPFFLHDRGAKLKGGTFPEGTKRLRIEYTVDERDPRQVVLRITPEVIEERMRTTMVEQGGEILTIRDHEGRMFQELAASLRIGPGEFLVLGGSAEAQDGYLLGSWWLTSQLEMRHYETVLCITPQPVRLE